MSPSDDLAGHVDQAHHRLHRDAFARAPTRPTIPRVSPCRSLRSTPRTALHDAVAGCEMDHAGFRSRADRRSAAWVMALRLPFVGCGRASCARPASCRANRFSRSCGIGDQAQPARHEVDGEHRDGNARSPETSRATRRGTCSSCRRPHPGPRRWPAAGCPRPRNESAASASTMRANSRIARVSSGEARLGRMCRKMTRTAPAADHLGGLDIGGLANRKHEAAGHAAHRPSSRLSASTTMTRRAGSGQ